MSATLGRLIRLRARSSMRSSRRSESILASKVAASVVKQDEKDVEKIPPLSPRTPEIPASYRYIYPEFLPDPDMTRRNAIREKLERQDMLKRRTVIDIPEFYPGTIMAVTTSDPHAPTKASKFVGICVWRGGPGLESSFVLRNAIDGLGVEIR